MLADGDTLGLILADMLDSTLPSINVLGEFWLLYSVSIQSADSVELENLYSSCLPSKALTPEPDVLFPKYIDESSTIAPAGVITSVKDTEEPFI